MYCLTTGHHFEGIEMIYTLSVAASGTESGFVGVGGDISEVGAVAIVTPGTLTSTTITIQPSVDGTNALTHYDYTGISVTIPIGVSRWISLDPALFAGFPYLRIVTGSAEAAAREFKVVITAIA